MVSGKKMPEPSSIDFAADSLSDSCLKFVMNTDLELQIYHYRLAQRLGNNAIQSVKATPDGSVITVTFRNGHVVDTTPGKIISDDFFALCTLLHDLPPVLGEL